MRSIIAKCLVSSLAIAGTLVTFASALRGVATASATAWQDEACFSVQVEMVGLNATVQDRSGKLVPGLSREDFTILDNGEPQVITEFSREDTPLSVTVLLDTSSSMRGRITAARESLKNFLEQLNPADEVMLMTFSTRPEIVRNFTRQFENLGVALNCVEGRGFTALYDSILAALEHAKAAQHRRRALLLISDGLNTRGRAELQDAVSQLRRHAVEFFAIALDTTPSYNADKLLSRFALGRLTASGGGGAFVVSDLRRIATVCTDIAERMHKQYTFGYYPPRAADGGWRSIRISSKVPGLRVLASKTGYFPLQRTASFP
jgi:Ca-activated chloride channel family protein